MPAPIPQNRFLIPMKSRGDYTTFGPTMADLFPDIPEGYTRNRMDPQLRAILEQVARKIETGSRAKATRVLTASPFVEVSTMLERNGKRMLLHAVNYDVTVDGTVTPARNLRVQVTLPAGKKARRVAWNGTLAEMKPIRYTATMNAGRQTLLLNLDQVDVYGLANIEME